MGSCTASGLGRTPQALQHPLAPASHSRDKKEAESGQNKEEKGGDQRVEEAGPRRGRGMLLVAVTPLFNPPSKLLQSEQAQWEQQGLTPRQGGPPELPPPLRMKRTF